MGRGTPGEGQQEISAWITAFTVWSVDGDLFVAWDNRKLIAVRWQDKSEKHREACIFPTGHNSIIRCGVRLQKMSAFSSINGCFNILIIGVARCCRLEMSPPLTLYLYRVTHRGPLRCSMYQEGREPEDVRQRESSAGRTPLTISSLAFVNSIKYKKKKKKLHLPTACTQCFVWISEQIAIISLYSINWMVLFFCWTGFTARYEVNL
jgi:hypothetical protein